MSQARVDDSVDRTFRLFLPPDLFIPDHMGLHPLTAQQSTDLYELILNRHRPFSFVITSNQAVDEWLSLFDDPIPGNCTMAAWPTPVTRLSSKEPAAGNRCRRTAPAGRQGDD